MRNVGPLKLNRSQKKNDVEPTSDRPKSSLEFTKTLEQTVKYDIL